MDTSSELSISGSRDLPREMVVALVLIGAGVLQSWLSIVRTWGPSATLLTFNLDLAFMAFEATVLYKIWQGRNWARWLYLVCIVFAAIFLCLILLSVPEGRAVIASAGALDVVVMGALLLAHAVSLWMLFLSEGRRWFTRGGGVRVA